MLSLEELRRAVPLLEARLRGHRVQAIAQPDAASVVFSPYGGGSAERSGEKHHLVLACRAGCARVGLRFDERMLSWPPGPRESDGCWAPYWYASVEASTSFAPPRPRPDYTSELDRLPLELRQLAENAIPMYETLADARLVV